MMKVLRGGGDAITIGISSSAPQAPVAQLGGKLSQSTHLGAKEHEEEAAKIESGQDTARRIVRIGFNLLSVDGLDDKTNTFHVNFLLHCKWFHKEGEDWHPWIQWKNAYDISEMENKGAVRCSPETKVGNIVESTNYVGTFAKTMDVRHFPFDIQELTMIMVCNSTKDVVLSYLSPGAIKANFEYDILTEWDIVRDPDTLQAISYFSFEGADPRLSNEGQAYNNFIFTMLVKRNPWALTLSLLVPASALSLSCLCAFTLDIATNGPGERYGIVFTILLTLVALQLTTKDRLPIVPYLTLVDWYMYFMQFICYLVGIEAGYVSLQLRFGKDTSIPGSTYDYYATIAVLVIIGVFYVLFIIRALYLLALRQGIAAGAKQKGERSRLALTH